MSQDAGWHRDPTGRHAQRYWDGKWTGFVAGAGGGDAEPDPLLPSEQFPPPGQELPAPSTPAPVETEAAATTTSLIATSATATAPAPVPAPIPSPGPPSPPPPPSTPPANWYADPAARHHHRYWDGSAWTSHVADGGQSGDEPLDPAYQDAVPVPMRQTTPAAVQPTAAQGSPMAPTSQSPYPAADGAAPSLGAVASSEAAPSTLPGASPAPSSVMFDPPAVAEPPTAAGAWAASPVQAAGASSPVTASKRSGWDLSRWVQLGALVAMAVGVLTAWATTSNSFVSASVNGIDSNDGKIFAGVLIFVAVVVVLSELRGGSWWIAAAVGGGALLAFGVYEVIHIHNKGQGVVSPGFGLYLDVAGAILLTAAAATLPRFRKTS